MGHIRLRDLPRTRRWQQVVNLIQEGAAAAQVANATIRAAERGLRLAADNRGVIESIWLLAQLPLAAREDDFAAALRACRLDLHPPLSLMQIVGAFTHTGERSRNWPRFGNSVVSHVISLRA